MKRELVGDVTKYSFEGGADLAFVKEFTSSMSKKNRESFFKLTDKVGTNKDVIQEEGDIKVRLVDLNSRGGMRRASYYYDLSLEGKRYFVKKVPAKEAIDYGGGAEELLAMQKAKELLKDLEEVEVVEYQLGYTDKQNTIYIAKWNDVLQTNLEEYIKPGINHEPEIEKIASLSKKIISKLRPYFFDVKYRNMAFDNNTGKIIVFDLMLKPNEDEESTQFVE